MIYWCFTRKTARYHCQRPRRPRTAVRAPAGATYTRGFFFSGSGAATAFFSGRPIFGSFGFFGAVAGASATADLSGLHV